MSKQQEKSILDLIEQRYGITLYRQFPIFNYRLDGYDRASNVAVEVNESRHFKRTKIRTDLIRQMKIIRHLRCSWITVWVDENNELLTITVQTPDKVLANIGTQDQILL